MRGERGAWRVVRSCRRREWSASGGGGKEKEGGGKGKREKGKGKRENGCRRVFIGLHLTKSHMERMAHGSASIANVGGGLPFSAEARDIVWVVVSGIEGGRGQRLRSRLPSVRSLGTSIALLRQQTTCGQCGREDICRMSSSSYLQGDLNRAASSAP